VNASFTNHCREGLEHIVHIEEGPRSAVGQYACINLTQMLSFN